jgi:pentatricopeptide repeat protein
MRSDRVEPDNVTYLCILKACGLANDAEAGAKIESEIRKRGLLIRDVALGNALIDMLARCGSLAKAQDAFDALPLRDVVTWNTLIGAYGQMGRNDEALECFARMQQERAVIPDVVTFTSVLKACASSGALQIGETIDAEVRRRKLIRSEIAVATSLIDMYAKCGALAKAREVLRLMPERDAVSWTALMSGYTEHGHGHEALGCLQEMAEEGISPDAVTYVCALKACGIIRSLEAGKQIEAELIGRGLLDFGRNLVLGNALVDMYAKCDALESAEDAFGRLSVRDVVSWNSLLSGYTQCKRSEEALGLFRRMQNEERVRPDEVTYTCALRACSLVGSLELGEQIAAEVHKRGLLQSTAAVLGNALVDMYAKCGLLTKAQEAFERLPVRDVVAWNSLIAGHAQLGRADAVLGLVSELRANGVAPNAITFLASLTACSHAGLLREGQMIFASLYYATVDDDDGGGDDDDDDDDGIIVFPSPQHYTCMVDLFVRAGRFDDAAALLGEVPGSDHLPLFLAVLGACQRWPNLEPVARWAFEQSVRVDEMCGAPYACMENIYAAAATIHR